VTLWNCWRIDAHGLHTGGCDEFSFNEDRLHSSLGPLTQAEYEDLRYREHRSIALM